MAPPVITFLTDYGLGDAFVGICHGVMARICPEARIIDISHGIARHDVRGGALVLRDALDYTPKGVHLAVVDPDVGARRRAVALRTADGRFLVGPDNGLLSLAAETAGGIIEAVDISRSPYRLEPVSATFHGRDIFAPVAAQLAAGAPLAEAGRPCDPSELVPCRLPAPETENGALIAHALYIDRFGNVGLNVSHAELAQRGLKLGRHVVLSPASGRPKRALYARTFADAPRGAMLVYEDAAQRLAVAVSHGDAAATLGVAVDDRVRIEPE